MKSRSPLWARLWVGASIAYGGLRITLVWRYLHQFGVNVWVFAGIELLASAIYGLSSVRAVRALQNRSWIDLRKWGLVTLASYGAPDLYVFASARTLPMNYLQVLLGVVVVTAVLTGIGIKGALSSNK